MKEPLVSTPALVNPHLLALTPVEWETVKEACDILKPFVEVTVKLSSERYVKNKVHQVPFSIQTVLLVRIDFIVIAQRI